MVQACSGRRRREEISSAMNLYITGEKVDIRPIGEENMDAVRQWYDEKDIYGFATGMRNVEEAMAVSPCSFFSGIYTKDGFIIGLVAGELRKTNETVLWLRTFLIDAAWQRKGFGTHSFCLLCNYAAKRFNTKKIYLSVPKKNAAGINFWNKMGMTCVKKLDGRKPENDGEVLILEKVL